MPSLTHPDWSREAGKGWSPSAGLLRAHRGFDRFRGRSGVWAKLRRGVCVLKHRFWSAVTGADIPLGTQLGGGLRLPHPNGIVIHPTAKIGVNCLIMQGVTIGTNIGTKAPEIGPGCDIGPGAKLLGSIKVGARAMIGANAVVTKDVPDLALAVGVPAQIHTEWNDRRGAFDGQDALSADHTKS
ncbi:MAG: serine acetyltransferase [Pseudomonadota bacterium]